MQKIPSEHGIDNPIGECKREHAVEVGDGKRHCIPTSISVPRKALNAISPAITAPMFF